MAANSYPCILYSNLFDLGTPTATDTASGYSVSNITDWRPYTYWVGNSAGTEAITVDTAATTSAADTLCIMGHNLYTATASVSLYSSTTGAWAGEEIQRLTAATPTDDKLWMRTFTSAVARYWQIRITTAAVAARIGIACLGSRLDFPRYPFGNFDPYPETLNADSARSKAGNLLQVTRQNVGIEVQWQFKNVTPTWIDSYFKTAWDNHLSLGKPFFASWDRTNHSTEAYLLAVPPGFTLAMPYDPYRRSITLKMEGVKEI